MDQPDELTERLNNWKRWLFLRDWMPARYRTILGMLYRSPQCWEMPEPRIIIDHIDAVLIEKTIHQMPDKYMKILILHHLGQVATGERVLRKVDRMEKYRLCGVPERTFYNHLHKAKIMLKNMLTHGKNRRILGVKSDSVDSCAIETQTETPELETSGL